MIQKITTYITPFQQERTVHIYLPDDYDQTDERYPVMYMYDGHNLYSDEDATYGKSWGFQEFLDQYDKKMIMVGIECNHEGIERLNEYCPYTLPHSFLGPITGKGKQFMDWFVSEFKPYIDQHYRTIPFRECTGIGGSSMGGLMALYTVIQYNQYFSKAACLSSSIRMCQYQLKDDLRKAAISPDTRVYLSHGKKETRGAKQLEEVQELLTYFYQEFVKREASCCMNITNGHHNEASWEKENPVFMDYLWRS